MKPQRQLVLRRERLTEIDHSALKGVAGATHIRTDCGCVTHGFSCEACPVPSLPVNPCVSMVGGLLSRLFDECFACVG